MKTLVHCLPLLYVSTGPLTGSLYVPLVVGTSCLDPPVRPLGRRVFHEASVVDDRTLPAAQPETELLRVYRAARCRRHRPYTIANDVSLRDLQFAEMRRGLILLGKNFDTTSPMGPYLVTKDDIPDPQNLQIRCWVNGDLRQEDTTANMTFSVHELVSYFSRTTLEPGDIIATGTPAGVGIFSNSPETALLRVGDTIDIEIVPIGRLSNPVIAESV